jgi:hypothetical protein
VVVHRIGLMKRNTLKCGHPRCPDYVSGFGIGYHYAEKVLNAMKPRELAALKQSLGIRPEREYAVVK